jgi:hypothetical protein
MTDSTSLIDMILNMLRNPSEIPAFQADPQSYLDACGAGDITPADLHDALVLAEDNQDGDFSRDYNTGGNHIVLPPAPPAPQPHPGESEHEAAIRYLNTYVTNNYVDDRDTIVDNSTNQQIDTHGGDFDQDIDVHSTVASGDGAVAAGDDIRDSTITTGDHNQVGDGNIAGDGNVVGNNNQAVTGDDNTTSFGSGNATSTDVGHDLNVGDGGAFASGGSAAVDNSDNSMHNVGNEETDNSINDSFKDSSDHSVTDSGNTHVDASTNDSYNDESHTETTLKVHDESDNSMTDDHSQHDVGNFHI